MKTTKTTFEPAWGEFHRHATVGDVDSAITKRTGVKRVSALRDLPGVRERFHTLFGQDPMHDFSEGVIVWYLQVLFRSMHGDRVRAAASNDLLETAKMSISSIFRWPKLKVEELMGETWHLNGTSLSLSLSSPPSHSCNSLQVCGTILVM